MDLVDAATALGESYRYLGNVQYNSKGPYVFVVKIRVLVPPVELAAEKLVRKRVPARATDFMGSLSKRAHVA